MAHPTPLTPQELEANILDTVARTCADMSRCADVGNIPALETHFRFLRETMNRLELIRRSTRRGPERPLG